MISLHDAMTRRNRPPTNLADEDQVVLFPSLASKSRDGKHWIVDLHGDVFAPGKLGLAKRVLLRWLRRAMQATADDLAGAIFSERIARFTAQNRPGRRLAVRVGHERIVTAKSRRNGHFQI